MGTAVSVGAAIRVAVAVGVSMGICKWLEEKIDGGGAAARGLPVTLIFQFLIVRLVALCHAVRAHFNSDWEFLLALAALGQRLP